MNIVTLNWHFFELTCKVCRAESWRFFKLPVTATIKKFESVRFNNTNMNRSTRGSNTKSLVWTDH